MREKGGRKGRERERKKGGREEERKGGRVEGKTSQAHRHLFFNADFLIALLGSLGLLISSSDDFML